jgi:two-component system sensor histidine kinase UhpB
MNLQLKVSLLIIVPMLLILAASTLIAYSRQRERALASMSLLASQTGQVIEHSLQDAMLAADAQRIQTTLDALAQDPRIQTLYLLDTDGQVAFAPKGEGVGQRLYNQDPTCQPCHRLSPEDRPSGVVVTTSDGQTVFRSMHPIENQPECQQCHDPDQRLNGLLLTDISIAPVEGTLADDLRDNLAWLVGTVIITAVLAYWAINRWVLRRLSGLAGAMEDVGHGGFQGDMPELPDDEIGRLSAAFNRMADQVETREDENRALSERLRERAEERGQLLERLIAAQEEERKRVARELHDDLGQSLSSTALSVEIAKKAFESDPSNATEHLARANDLIADATDRMYDLILGLRPSVLDDLGLLAALRAHAVRTLEPEGIEYQISSSGLSGRLPSHLETALFRIFQEAMSNVIRHAEASHVNMSINIEDSILVAKMVDDGVGFNPETYDTNGLEERGLGILGMRERATLIGGEVEIGSQAGRGTKLQVVIPLTEMTGD